MNGPKLEESLGDSEYQLTFLYSRPLDTTQREGTEVVEHVLHLPKHVGEGDDTRTYLAKPTG